MTTTIITKNSSTAGAAPLAADLVQGELAVNVTSKALYTKNASAAVVKLNTPSIVDNGDATAITIDSSENVGIGTSDPTNGGSNTLAKDLVVSRGTGVVGMNLIGSENRIWFSSNSALAMGYLYYNQASNYLAIATNNTERARIDTSGNLLVNTTNPSLSVNQGIKLLANADFGTVVNSSTGGSSHIHLYNLNATNNGFRFYVLSNGGIANYSGNNSNLSDERTKINIELAGNYLDKVCSIPVKLFNYKDEAEGEQRTLGVIAQDVEAVAPELVNQDGWKVETTGDEPPLKSVYTTDMMFALMKAIQEQQALINAQQAALTTLTERITALEAK